MNTDGNDDRSPDPERVEPVVGWPETAIDLCAAIDVAIPDGLLAVLANDRDQEYVTKKIIDPICRRVCSTLSDETLLVWTWVYRDIAFEWRTKDWANTGQFVDLPHLDRGEETLRHLIRALWLSSLFETAKKHVMGRAVPDRLVRAEIADELRQDVEHTLTATEDTE